MANSNQVGVYTLGTFGAKNPTPAQQQAMLAEAQAISASDFNLVMLASMHVHKDGSLWFNDTLMVSSNPPTPGGELSPNLAQCIATMKKKSGAGGKVLASFGGGGMFNGNAVGYWDFLGIKNLIAQYPNPANNPFFQNLKWMFDTYPGIDGLDLDLESYTGYAEFTSTVATIIKWLVSNGRIAVLCPYDTPDFWCDVVKQTSSGGKPTVAWINLQNASGTLESFVGPLKQVGIGLADIVGGLQTDGMGPSDVTSVFSAIESQYSGIGGGWLWNLEAFGTSNTAAYASAVAAGLGGSSIRKAS